MAKTQKRLMENHTEGARQLMKILLRRRRKEIEQEYIQSQLNKDSKNEGKNTLDFKVTENPNSKNEMDRFLLIVSYIVEEEDQTKQEISQHEEEVLLPEIKAFKGHYRALPRKGERNRSEPSVRDSSQSEPMPWWHESMSKEEIVKRLQDIKDQKDNPRFGRNVLPTK